jgi:hypothetical protein
VETTLTLHNKLKLQDISSGESFLLTKPHHCGRAKPQGYEKLRQHDISPKTQFKDTKVDKMLDKALKRIIFKM